MKEREDLQILHRSLRAQGEGESSSHLEDLHEAISQLVMRKKIYCSFTWIRYKKMHSY